MSYIVTKTIKGHDYLYEYESVRVDGKPKARFIRYIGPAALIADGMYDIKHMHINEDTRSKAKDYLVMRTLGKVFKGEVKGISLGDIVINRPESGWKTRIKNLKQFQSEEGRKIIDDIPEVR